MIVVFGIAFRLQRYSYFFYYTNFLLFFCYFSFRKGNIPLIKDGWDGCGHDECDGHADERHGAERVHCGMLCEDEDADADEHDGRGKDNRLAVLRQNRLAGAMLINQAFNNEDGVIVSLSENECSEDNIDDIKLNTKQLHDSKNPNPAERHGNKSNECQPETAETEDKEDEDNQAAAETDIIEVVA